MQNLAIYPRPILGIGGLRFLALLAGLGCILLDGWSLVIQATFFLLGL